MKAAEIESAARELTDLTAWMSSDDPKLSHGCLSDALPISGGGSFLELSI